MTDEAGEIDFTWSYSASGEVLSGPQGPYVLLDCPDGVYDWSTGLIFLNGRYFDPALGIWIALGIALQGRPWSRKRKRRRWVWLLWVLVVLAVTMMSGCGSGSPSCQSIAKYNGNPSAPGTNDAAILDASVIIQPLIGSVSQSRSLGTIVGQDGTDWIIYTHNHFEQANASGVKLHDRSINSINIYSHDMRHQAKLLMGASPSAKIDYKGQRTRLKVNSSLLDGTGAFPSIGKPISRIDSAGANVGDQVDIAYFAPAGVGSTHVEVWHTRIVDLSGVTPPGTVAVLGTPTPGGAFGPGASGDSGGGLFRNGEHIGNTWNWIESECREGATLVGIDVWISYLNP